MPNKSKRSVLQHSKMRVALSKNRRLETIHNRNKLHKYGYKSKKSRTSCW